MKTRTAKVGSVTVPCPLLNCRSPLILPRHGARVRHTVFQNIIQPMIEDCADCLHVPDKDGRTPLHVLSGHRLCADMLRAQLGSAATADRPPPDAWHDKIWEEMQYENDRFDRYDQGEMISWSIK